MAGWKKRVEKGNRRRERRFRAMSAGRGLAFDGEDERGCEGRPPVPEVPEPDFRPQRPPIYLRGGAHLKHSVRRGAAGGRANSPWPGCRPSAVLSSGASSATALHRSDAPRRFPRVTRVAGADHT